jgi:tRNA U34 2-thiouridine synthase MnmA/TrmU
MRRAIVLTSGGLDSMLTLHILQKQGVKPSGLHFRSWFLVRKFRDFDSFPQEAKVWGFTILNRDVSEEYTPLLLYTQFGHGSGANPCVDCKLLFLKKAKKLMNEIGASFVATGEVLGQRPMSQRPEVMKLLEKRSGLEGYLNLCPIPVMSELVTFSCSSTEGISEFQTTASSLSVRIRKSANI